MEVPVIEFLLFQVSWIIFLIYFLIPQFVILYSQVENSSTAQVGGPQDAVGEVEPTLAGSDVPLPEDGFTHEVNYLILRAAYLMLYFQALGVD